MKRLFISALATLMIVPVVNAGDIEFDRYFTDNTLRLDYIFSGDSQGQEVRLDELLTFPGWAGRRHRLEKLPLGGNGEVVMTDALSGDTIYRTSFSSLFQEWVCEEEALRVKRAFENTFLVPMPKAPVDVTVALKDTRHHQSAVLTHRVDPSDILIRRIGGKTVVPHRYLHRGGDPADVIDVVIMAEGYADNEIDRFYADAQVACDALLAHEPFGSMADRFNIVAVASPSADSGVSLPREGQWRDTAVGSHFDTFYSDRYLTTRRVKNVHDWLVDIPYEHIIILANTDTYGGGGIYNSYTLTTAHHEAFRPVVVHEFGHSFGGLADEYAYGESVSPQYPAGTEPWEPNITTLTDFESKWADMLPKNTPVPTPVSDDKADKYSKVGVYEGAGYAGKGVYRPVDECRMRVNSAPEFCPVCQRALKRLILFYTEKE